jgi:segregation and condensation protein B
VSAEDPTEPPDVPPDPDAAAEAPTDAPTAAPEPADDLPEGPAELEASERSAEPADDLPQEPAELEASERSAEPATDLPQEPAEQEASELPADPPDPDAELIDLADIDPDDPLAAMLAELDAPRRPAPAGVQLSEELPIDPEDDLRGVEGEASLRLVSILESLLFAAARPLKVQDLRRILAETSKHQIQLALAHLMAITKDRGVMLAQVAGGFQFRTHPDNAVWVQKMLQTKPARLSRTQIETLAIVAYRQPITRPEIDDVRGVDSGAVLKGLLERELVQIVGKKEEPGRPLLYGTTIKFLEFFNLRGLRDLPTLRDFRDLSEESKATLRTQLGATEAEALGQGVLGFPAATAVEEGIAEMSQQPEQDPTPVEFPGGDAPQGEPEPVPMELPGDPSPDEIVPPAPEQLPGPGPDEIRPPDPGTDSPNQPDEWHAPGPDIADVPGVDPGTGGPTEV